MISYYRNSISKVYLIRMKKFPHKFVELKANMLSYKKSFLMIQLLFNCYIFSILPSFESGTNKTNNALII